MHDVRQGARQCQQSEQAHGQRAQCQDAQKLVERKIVKVQSCKYILFESNETLEAYMSHV